MTSRTLLTNRCSYFVDYEGGLDCRLSSTELYIPPDVQDPVQRKKYNYCQNRAELLMALNGGGRHGFEQPYHALGSFLALTTVVRC